MKIVKILLVYVLLISTNAFATEVFKCVQPDGKNVFSDKPCPKGIEEEKVTYKDLPWEKALEARKPPDVKITELRKVKGDTLITYRFFNQTDSNAFMKLAHELSKQNVNLLKIKVPVNSERGEAVIQVTKKDSKLFKKDNQAKRSI